MPAKTQEERRFSARLLIRSGAPANLPRPSLSPVQVKIRLMSHFRPLARVH